MHRYTRGEWRQARQARQFDVLVFTFKISFCYSDTYCLTYLDEKCGDDFHLFIPFFTPLDWLIPLVEAFDCGCIDCYHVMFFKTALRGWSSMYVSMQGTIVSLPSSNPYFLPTFNVS